MLSAVVAVSLLHPLAAAAAPGPPRARISGRATKSAGDPIANAIVRVRNISSGQITVSKTKSSGEFEVSGLQAGEYAIEIVDSRGQIVAVSRHLHVDAGGAVTGLTVASGGAIAAAVAAETATATGAAGTVAGTVVTAAVAAGVTAMISVRDVASRSR